jgi:hypothetical protein
MCFGYNSRIFFTGYKISRILPIIRWLISVNIFSKIYFPTRAQEQYRKMKDFTWKTTWDWEPYIISQLEMQKEAYLRHSYLREVRGWKGGIDQR